MLSRTTTSTAAALIHGLERYSVSTLGRQLTLRSTYASVLSRHFSSHTDVPTPTIDLAQLQATIFSQTAQISRDLSSRGYFTTVSILPLDEVTTLRSQAISLRKEGRYVPSFSEKLVGDTIQRFDKEGVYACEPDGGDYYTAPDLISYIATILQTLPPALNDEEETRDNELSNAAFNAKLAVTTGGSRYPCHIDNPVGNGLDVRKLTAILYLNPAWKEGDGGEIRLFVKDEEEVKPVDLSPVGGRLLLFWSDEIPHEVLPTACSGHSSENDDVCEKSALDVYSESDRYALTVWIPTDNRGVLHDERSKFASLKDLVHFG
jgi:Rps23 Pro-64 3,4-dihydroxylase Tpa1-like proline 4-hydroxylase